MTVFAHSLTTNKLEAAKISARVGGQDRKMPPALGTNQIAGSGGFRPLTSLEKKFIIIIIIIIINIARFFLNQEPDKLF